ncbi:MAG: hypothetical protein FWG73_04255 [Planctomycetaceae bacterium]|nr:hypothetical protein [Planctomycetaceae bacterium]
MKQHEHQIRIPLNLRQRICRGGIVLCALIALIALLFPATLFASEENVVEYRRWFIPLEKIGLFAGERSLQIDRHWFESQLERLTQRAEQQNGNQPGLSNIVLKAKLEGRQLVSGEGRFTLHSRTARSSSILLEPLTLPLHSLHWSDGSEAILFYEKDSGQRLLIPAGLQSRDQLQFQWSLQSRKENRNEIVFDIELPPCLNIELQIELPASQILTSSAGLVLPGEVDTDTELRTWQVLLGHHSQTTLSIAEDRTLTSANHDLAIQQVITYTIGQVGLEATTRVIFDSVARRPDELLLELEMPLRPVDIMYGDQPAPWTRSAISPDITEVRVDLSAFSDDERQELSIRSLGPLLENQRWTLPRIRVTSPDVFWLETRCGVSIYDPLRARNIIPHQAAQVPTRANTVVDWTLRELYVFQFFQDDAQIELEVFHSIPQIAVNSAVQVDWRDNEIRSTVYLECSITEGQRFTLNFPISENWLIDSVTTYSPSLLPGETDSIFSWNILRDESDQTSQTLSVQLNTPLHAQRSLILQLSCRFIHSLQNQFRLAELSPIVLTPRSTERHYAAIRHDLTYHSLKASQSASAFDIASVVFGINQLPMSGNIYPLNTRTQDIHFELERTRPNYTADVAANIYIDHAGLMPTFRIRYTPIDTSISRVFVYFTPFRDDNQTTVWDWSLSGTTDTLRPLRARQISPTELRSMLSVAEQQNWNEDLYRGEIWEIRFDELQTAPFELVAVSLLPLADSMAIPLAVIPLASSQRGEITITSPQRFNYRIVNARFDSIPIAPPAWDSYQQVRAAFRYEPLLELRRSQHAPLSLQLRTPEEQVDTAWVWSLRLDSYHEPEGMVRNRALFLVENQGQDTLQITLPRSIEPSDVSAIWQDSQQIAWHYNEEQNTVDVDLPIGQRFVSISVEYLHQDIPLVQQRRLRPQYPSANIPILSGSWVAWFPPEFDISLRRTAVDTLYEAANNASASKALEYLLAGTYQRFFWSEWDRAFNAKQRRLEAETASQYFFEEIVAVLQSDVITTCGGLVGNEKILTAVRSRLADETKRAVASIEIKLLIDRQALTFLGITPATPIESIGSITNRNVRERLFEQAGLVLLVSTNTRADGIKEYVFALTTPMMLSFDRQFQPMPAGHSVRVVPFEFFESASESSADWITSQQWIQEPTLFSIPWSVSTQVIQGTALTSDWNAYELPINAELPLYIVHRQKVFSLQWLAFLSVLLLTWRKPLASPILLIVLLVVFELVARAVAPCYIGIPSGAFLGAIVSLAFVLIRSYKVTKKNLPDYRDKNDSTECSASFVQTPLLVRHALLFAILLGLCGSSFAQEPYRVVYPIDSEGQHVGNHVFLPLEFLRLLSQDRRPDDSATLHSSRWHLTKAVYQGSLVRSTSGYLECAEDFVAVYDIYLDSTDATVILPNLPYIPESFFWNDQPIHPILTDEATNGTLMFLIENETPGMHTLEIGLSPRTMLRNDGETFQIDFAIPQVPHSTLSLNVPSDIATINVHHAMGAVTPNSIESPVVHAELGLIEQLSFSWVDGTNQNGTSTSEVEQFLWMRAKPLQVELEMMYRFRIDGQVQSLSIQTEPRWFRSGQFRCDEHPIVSQSHTTPEQQSFNGPYTISHLEFQSPVSGTITLRADFMLLDFNDIGFNGIGNVRLPEFQALQSQITRSMLAVSADPSLELILPIEGRSSGFDTAWYRTPTIAAPLFGTNPIWEMAAREFAARRDDASRESPEAAFDLMQTESDWTLNIRAKKIIPEVDVTQSIQFDSSESRINVFGAFTASAHVFRQQFSTDRPIQIASIEVRDAQDELLDSRYQQISEKQYLIVFKNHVAGQYTIAIRGAFDTNMQEAEMQEEIALQTVPTLTFDDVRTNNHSLYFFRTPDVIAEVSATEYTAWSRSNITPVAPATFIQPIPLDTWLKEELPESTLPETTNSKALHYFVFANRPTVHSTTELVLQDDSEGRWTMFVDFNANITGGELRNISFRWDERCGIIQSVEPAASYSLEQIGGQQILTILPTDAMKGETQFNLNVSLNTAGRNIALPNVFPLDRNIYQLESEIFVELPNRQGNEMIHWERSMLEPIVSESGEEDSLSRYRALDTNFAAAISQVESRLTALFYDIGFLINRDGTIIGSVTVDLRNQGQDHCIVQMPPGYSLIQIASAGSILGHTRLEDEQRFHINIGTSDYPQRLNILFRAPRTPMLRTWDRKTVLSALHFPVLEGVIVQDTIWTVAFGGNVPELKVESMWDASGVNNLHEHVPLSGTDAALSLIGLNLIREHNLLRILNAIPSGRPEEMRRWFLHWSAEWDTVADKVDFQVSHLPLTLQNVRPSLIVRPAGLADESEDMTGIVRPFLETISANAREALRSRKEQTVGEKFGTVMDSVSRQTAPVLNSQVYWQGRLSEEMRYLFGAEEGSIQTILLTSNPSEGNWADWVSSHILLWVILGLLLPIFVLSLVRWVYLAELWYQFPHFWGMCFGVLLWTFLPESFIGILVILLTVLSFFRPSWPRHRTAARPF